MLGEGKQVVYCGRVVIAGGSGFLGRSLARRLQEEGLEPIVLSRGAAEGASVETIIWDGRTLGDWVRCLDGAEAVINLAGRSVDCRKTPENRDEILRSRVDSTLVLGRAMAAVQRAPKVWIQSSTAHIYGDSENCRCSEESTLGLGLAPDVGRAWEAAFWQALPSGVRPVVLRGGFVLGRNGGVLQRLAGLARFGLGGTVGSGRQGMSWLHQLDFDRLALRAIDDATMQGIFVASAPKPISNQAFMATLRQSLGVRVGLPAPAWLVRIGAACILNTDPELALYGRYCVSTRLEQEGFVFRFPELRAALDDLLHSIDPT